MRTILRGILLCIVLFSVCVLFGEPSEGVDMLDLVVIKSIAVGVGVMCWYVFMKTLSSTERNDIMDEEV